MILETLRVLGDWLGHGTYGVNAKLAVLTLDGTDARPAAVVTLVEESNSGLLALKRLSQETTALPALGVLQVGAFDLITANVATTHQQADGRVAVWYIGQQAVDAEDGRQAGLYTLRAVRQSLRDLMRDTAVPAAARSRNGVQLIEIGNLALLPAFAPVEGVVVTAALEMTAKVRDTSL